MNYCKNCGCIFDDDEAKIVEERHGFRGGNAEEFMYCPNCNSDDFTEARQCEECGEWFSEDDLFGGAFCEECLDEMYKADKDWFADKIVEENLKEVKK